MCLSNMTALGAYKLRITQHTHTNTPPKPYTCNITYYREENMPGGLCQKIRSFAKTSKRDELLESVQMMFVFSFFPSPSLMCTCVIS